MNTDAAANQGLTANFRSMRATRADQHHHTLNGVGVTHQR